jgi:hypothetical protein
MLMETHLERLPVLPIIHPFLDHETGKLEAEVRMVVVNSFWDYMNPRNQEKCIYFIETEVESCLDRIKSFCLSLQAQTSIGAIYGQIIGRGNSRPTETSSTYSTESLLSQRKSNENGKRKRAVGGYNNNDDDENTSETPGDGRDNTGSTTSPMASKHAGLSCPYRKRNPARFNVRDYRVCAMRPFQDFTLLK